MQPEMNAINREAIEISKEFTGEFALLTVALTFFTLAGVIASLWLFVDDRIHLWLAVPLYAVLTYMSYTPLHEAVHNNIHGRHDNLKWVNDLCGYLAATVIMVPYSTHKIEHFTHHRYTNDPQKDPDYVVNQMRHGFLSFLASGFKFLWVQMTFLFRNHWQTTTPKDKTIYLIEIAVSVGWRLCLGVWIGSMALTVLLVLGYLLGAFFTAYWFAYRPHHPYASTLRYENTNSLIMPSWMKPIEWLWLGQNLHSIHHLFPRVPFFRYHALHQRIESNLRAMGTPVIGIFSRKAIDRKLG